MDTGKEWISSKQRDFVKMWQRPMKRVVVLLIVENQTNQNVDPFPKMTCTLPGTDWDIFGKVLPLAGIKRCARSDCHSHIIPTKEVKHIWDLKWFHPSDKRSQGFAQVSQWTENIFSFWASSFSGSLLARMRPLGIQLYQTQRTIYASIITIIQNKHASPVRIIF